MNEERLTHRNTSFTLLKTTIYSLDECFFSFFKKKGNFGTETVRTIKKKSKRGNCMFVVCTNGHTHTLNHRFGVIGY